MNARELPAAPTARQPHKNNACPTPAEEETTKNKMDGRREGGGNRGEIYRFRCSEGKPLHQGSAHFFFFFLHTQAGHLCIEEK